MTVYHVVRLTVLQYDSTRPNVHRFASANFDVFHRSSQPHALCEKKKKMSLLI